MIICQTEIQNKKWCSVAYHSTKLFKEKKKKKQHEVNPMALAMSGTLFVLQR